MARRPHTGTTLWSQATPPDPAFLAYTAGSDQVWDAPLLRWDILGSLGHLDGLRAARLLTPGEFRRGQAALRRALREADAGRLRLTRRDEDVHTAVERWLSGRDARLGALLHTGRSRNDQVSCDLRLHLKDQLLELHALAADVIAALLDVARRERNTLWPGYTHTRRAMPSSVALWAGGYAEGMLVTLEGWDAVWAEVDRSPLGTAAGYGVPLPLRREAVARALGFGALDQVVTATQGSRGRLEASVLFWCCQLGYDLARFSSDVILLSGEELGFVTLPAGFVTGSSIMPQKRNPDLFEITRARVALLEGALAAVFAIRSRLTGGYHRDFQLLKEPLGQGLGQLRAILAMVGRVIPRLGFDRARARRALEGDLLATDWVMDRVEAGEPFRAAYHAVAAALRRGEPVPPQSVSRLVRRRRSTGGIGNPGLGALRQRLTRSVRRARARRRRFDQAMRRLARGSA